MENQIIWQPQSIYQPGFSFCILLNPEFAREMFNSKLSSKNYQRMQELPKKIMGFSKPEPYIFHKDTCFIRQINLNAGDGKWLSLEDACCGAEPNFDKLIKYSTHNLDYRHNPEDTLTLMGLFNLWIEYSKYTKEK